jgi:hypothetical protein
MNLRRLLALGALLGFPFMAAAATDEPRIRLEPSCSWSQAAAKFTKVVVDNQGNLEPLHLSEGVVVLATAETAAGAAAIRKAATILREDFRKFRSNVGGTPCELLLSAAQSRKLNLQLEETSKGVLLAFLSRNSEVVRVLHSNCCDYCICPSNNYRCAGCC